MVTTRKATGSLPEKRRTDAEAAPPVAKKKRAKSARTGTASKKSTPNKKKRITTKTEPPMQLPAAQSNPEVPPLGAKCPLLCLPAELRNEIFSTVLGGSSTIPVAPNRPHIKEPALAAVNRQIRSETISMWYEDRAFEITGSSPAVRILRSLRVEQLRMIRCLRIITHETMSLIYIWERITQLMRDAGPRGLSKDALHFRDAKGTWLNLREVKRLLRPSSPR